MNTAQIPHVEFDSGFLTVGTRRHPQYVRLRSLASPLGTTLRRRMYTDFKLRVTCHAGLDEQVKIITIVHDLRAAALPPVPYICRRLSYRNRWETHRLQVTGYNRQGIRINRFLFLHWDAIARAAQEDESRSDLLGAFGFQDASYSAHHGISLVAPLSDEMRCRGETFYAVKNGPDYNVVLKK